MGRNKECVNKGEKERGGGKKRGRNIEINEGQIAIDRGRDRYLQWEKIDAMRKMKTRKRN